MNTCKRCGKENQDHYKFCLGCGAELTSGPPGPSAGAAMAKTVVADASQLLVPGAFGPPGAPPPVQPPSPLGGVPAPAAVGAPGTVPRVPTPGGGVPMSPSGMAPAGKGKPMGMPSPLSVAGPPSPMAPGFPPPADPFGRAPAAPHLGGPPPPLGGGPPSGLGGPMPPAIAAQPPMASPMAPSPASAAPGGDVRKCPACGYDVPAAFVFCGACGNRMGPAVVAPARPATSQQPAPEVRVHGQLTLIRPDGTEGGTHDLEEGENKIGRSHGAAFAADGYLSPLHAELILNAAGAVVRDMDSLNGVFVRISTEEEIEPGDVFRLGQELIRFEPIAPPATIEDGTEIMGSPNPGYWGRLSLIIGKDQDGAAFPMLGDSITLGRERGDINFPDDGYVSGLHARLSSRGGKVYLADMGSSNGTFLKIRGERPVTNGTYFLLGQQLFRLTIS